VTTILHQSTVPFNILPDVLLYWRRDSQMLPGRVWECRVRDVAVQSRAVRWCPIKLR
jgi:hypothetical protein